MTWDDRAEEELDPDLKTGVGNPLSPYNDVVLTQREEKSIDSQGHKIVEKVLWSEASTGWYLWISLWSGSELTQLVPQGRGQSDISLEEVYGGTWSLSMGASLGKPRFNLPVVGACIEIPWDSYRDKYKKQYLAEWIVNTVVESLEDRKLPIPPEDSLVSLSANLEAAADRAIGTVL